MGNSVIIAIAGGSASGKTTIVKDIINALGSDNIITISHDDYYKCNDNLSMEERRKVNYDHPSALDNDLFYDHLVKLLNGEDIDKPIYDFKVHNRAKETEKVHPAKIIIIEGILVLEAKKIRDLADYKIFVQCDEDIRFIRRLQRDTKERGRELDDVIEQYFATVKPMFNKFIKPTTRYADIIIPTHRDSSKATDILISKIKDILNN